jgi:DNA-binding transcriptional LysR family regulator
MRKIDVLSSAFFSCMMNGIDLRRVDLNLLVVFEALMNEGSVTRAAARLSRTQSAVSHSLARLREQVGDPLLVRVAGQMRPSPRAESLALEVAPILRAAERALAPPAPFVPATSERVFTVAIPDLTPSLFVRLASAVRDAAPNAGVEWVARGERTASDVADGAIDVALLPAALPIGDGLVTADAGAFRWATFARRRHPAIARWGRAAWRKWPHLAVRVSAGLPAPVEIAAGRITRRIAVWVPHFSAVAPLLAQTDLVTTLPTVVLYEAMEMHGLVALPVPFAIAPMRHRWVIGARFAGDPAVRWIRDVAAQALAATLAATDAKMSHGRNP